MRSISNYNDDRYAGYGYNGERDIANAIEAQKDKEKQEAKEARLAERKKIKINQQILYDKKYSKVSELIGKLNEFLSEYSLEIDSASGSYKPVDIKVHIIEITE